MANSSTRQAKKRDMKDYQKRKRVDLVLQSDDSESSLCFVCDFCVSIEYLDKCFHTV